MRKWTAMLLGALLVVSITACSTDEAKSDNTPATSEANTTAETTTKEDAKVPTAKELIEKVTAAGADLKSFSMDSTIDQNMVISTGDQEQEQKVHMKLKNDMVKEPFAVYQEINLTMPGTETGQDIKQYITADGIYSSTGNVWMKLPAETAAPLLEQMKSQGSPEQQVEQFNAIIDKVEVTEEGDNYLLKATVSGPDVKEIAKSYMEQSAGSNPETAALLEQMDIKSMEMSYSVDKKNYFPVNTIVKMEMEMEMEGQKVGMVMDMSSTINNHNSVKEIKVPQEALDSAK
ncbi:hypothetical protein J2T13_001366 [Paenibacillus sp. DS2015]|uniref:DUF6612 family protein n=1 Tax=Paenibacillus sp. DS2015 TaxID=3373917 RepID=UPI003D1ED86C